METSSRTQRVLAQNLPGLAGGGSLGFLSGVVLLLFPRSFRRRPKSLAVLQKKLGLSGLAEIHKLPGSTRKGLEGIAVIACEGTSDAAPFLNLRDAIVAAAENPKRLIITSTERGDGKTTIATNLAVAFAKANRKTLLIDVDVRTAGTTQLLNLHRSRGLTQILRNEIPIHQSCLENVFNLGLGNLDVMPAGSVPFNLSGLFASERFNELMAWASSNYDQILFDAPNSFFLDDIKSVGRFADAALFVVHPLKNRAKTVQRAVGSCRTAGIAVIGFVANHITATRPADLPASNSRSFSADDSGDVVNEIRKPLMAA